MRAQPRRLVDADQARQLLKGLTDAGMSLRQVAAATSPSSWASAGWGMMPMVAWVTLRLW